MAHGLDVVTVTIDHKGTIVIWMKAGRAIVLGAGRERRGINGIDGALLGHKGDMQPAGQRIAAPIQK